MGRDALARLRADPADVVVLDVGLPDINGFQYGARSSLDIDGDPTATVMHVAAPMYAPDDPEKRIGVLALAQPNRSIDPCIEASQRNILQRGAWLIGISALIGVVMTWWLMRDIGRLNRYAQAVSAGIPVPPPRNRVAMKWASWARRWKACVASWKARPALSNTCSR